MTTIRFASALSAIALATALAACATSQQAAGGAVSARKADKSNLGLGTRALFALSRGDYAAAIELGERAVEQNPRDATVRAVLANAYFGAGRFASAEAAYRDSLSLNGNQPQLVLKLVLVQIAQGKKGEALSLLGEAQQMLDRADLGLALALAGQPHDAVAVLEPAARRADADSRLRQNLAFAHAFAGDWTAARTIAAQDLPADMVDQRIQQWMTLATPARPSDQVAALTGIAPAAVDPGQPVRLALHPVQVRTAEAAAAAPVAAAVQTPPVAPDPAPAVEVAQIVPPAAPAVDALAPEPAAAEPVAVAPEPEPAPALVQALLPANPPAAEPLPASFKTPRPVASSIALPKRAARGLGNANAVVQLGAYGSPQRVEAAWEQLSRKFPSLNRYRPVSARFNGPNGMVYRLAIRGFASNGDAQGLCRSLQAKGKACFVRRVAGDAPVRFASR